MGSSGGTCCLQVVIPVHLPQKVSGSLGAPQMGVLLIASYSKDKEKMQRKEPSAVPAGTQGLQHCPEQLVGLYAAQDRSANVPSAFHQDE